MAAVVAGCFVIGELGGAGGDGRVGTELVGTGNGAVDLFFGKGVGDPIGLLMFFGVSEGVMGVANDFTGGCGEVFLGDGETEEEKEEEED